MDYDVDVLGCRSTDSVLIIGRSAMSHISFCVKDVCYIETVDELNSEFVKHKVFDKIVVQEQIDINDLKRLATMNVGLICMMEENDESRGLLKDFVEAYWYPADAWDITNGIKCVLTNARGLPTYACEEE